MPQCQLLENAMACNDTSLGIVGRRCPWSLTVHLSVRVASFPSPFVRKDTERHLLFKEMFRASIDTTFPHLHDITQVMPQTLLELVASCSMCEAPPCLSNFQHCHSVASWRYKGLPVSAWTEFPPARGTCDFGVHVNEVTVPPGLRSKRMTLPSLGA